MRDARGHTAADVIRALRAQADPAHAEVVRRFFKTGPGEYGEGDKFLGVKVPSVRAVLSKLPVSRETALELLESPWHEARLFAVIALSKLYQKGTAAERRAVARSYLARTKFVNNWDLVDSSAHLIVGPEHATGRPGRLDALARSKLLWDRRIAMIATLHCIKQGDARDATRIAALLLRDEEDLIHKAVGWMLREVGERCGKNVLDGFLAEHAREMPRTALRYAIEHHSKAERAKWLAEKRVKLRG